MPDPQLPTGGINSRCRAPRAPVYGCRAGRLCAAFRLLQLLANNTTVRRYAAWAVPLLMLWVSLGAMLGCGQGDLSFDGGHIPTGGAKFATIITGTAYEAEAYTIPVAGATVVATNTSVAGIRETQTTTTTATGSFSFANGFPDATSVNEYQITVTPPVGSNRILQQITFPVNAGQAAMVLVAMPQTSFNQSQAAAVTILQQNYQVQSGQTVAIGAELLDLQGSPLPVSPSLVYTGSYGMITAGGQFTGTSAGVGSVSAYWYNGSTQLQSLAATVTAITSTGVQPPPPPPVSSPVSNPLN